MCKLCSSNKNGGDVHSPAPKTGPDSDPGANREPTSPDRLFSHDDNENKFMADICWIKPDHWIRSEMQWNTIHGIPWERLNDLGAGGYGSVCVGMRVKDQKLFAVKSVNVFYPMTLESRRLIRCQVTEIKMMRYLRSKYITTCLGCGRSNGSNGLNQMESLDVFMELSIRGSLRSIYKRRSYTPFEEDPYIRQYTYDLLKALQYMQKKRVVHGDIKMANILLGDDCVKLCDWGGAKQLKRNNLKKILMGTRGFRSPEVINCQQQSYPSDIFSLGCTVIEMATGKSPRRIQTKVMGLDKFLRPIHVEEDRIEIPNRRLSPEGKDFLEHCLCEKHEDRWTAAELLHHPFITNRDKTNNAPYVLVTVPPAISVKILQPPRRIHPEPPDEPITKRVYRHLTRSSVPKSWVANLAGCGPTDPPLYPPSPEFRNPCPAPAPLPLVPEIKPGDKNPLQTFLDGITPPRRPAPDRDLRYYGTPYNSQRIMIESPSSSSRWLPATLSTHGVATASSPALAKDIIGTAIPSEISDGAAPDVGVPNENLLPQDKRYPVKEAEEFHNEMLNSLGLMREINNNLYDEARIAAQQPLDDSADDHAVQLFPQLMTLAKNDPVDENGEQVDEPMPSDDSVIYRI